ncbi:hypothetical protein [Paraflavitalea pollutisoli]|uniref:hypothetical protein n=1 Tax=Paraflavitalea pollutisoli TaxID=3034143 RepID=UPI0023ECC768|nr:hypothetical protein [Paraflavitalea sp. H1-2-19X]
MKCWPFLLFAVITSAPAGAQRIHATDKTAWNPAPTKGYSLQRAAYFGFTPPQQALMRANMAKVMEQLHQTPVLHPPRGYAANLYATLCEYDCEGSKLLTGESTIVFLQYTRKPNSTVVERAPEGPSLHVWFNSISRIVSNIGLEKDAFFEEPYVTDTRQGFSVYGPFVAITRGAEPLFVPITREQYLKAEIKQAKERVEGIRKTAAEGSPYQQWLKTKEEAIKGALEGFAWAAKIDPAKAKADKEKFLKGMQQQESMYKASEAGYLKEQQGMIDKATNEWNHLQEELASLTPTQKAAPVTGPGGRTYVQANPRYFNTSLPASSVQLLVIDLYKYGQGHHLYNTFSDADKYLFSTLQETVDLKALQALLQ